MPATSPPHGAEFLSMRFPNHVTIITDEISQELAEVCSFVRSFGLPGIELRSMFGRAFKDLTPADIASIATACRDDGLKVFGCASPVFKCELADTAAIRAHVDIFKRSLETAQRLDCDLIRVFSFLRESTPLDEPKLQRIAAHLGELAELARAAKVRVAIENESSCIIGSGDEMMRLLAYLPNRDVGLIWDPCNVLYVPDGPAQATARFAALLSSIVHIHVKDAVRMPGRNPVPVPVGLGDVQWRDHLAEIVSGGYKGLLSLETHWRVEQIDEKLLHLPAGYAFSKGGREASATCLRNIESLCGLL